MLLPSSAPTLELLSHSCVVTERVQFPSTVTEALLPASHDSAHEAPLIVFSRATSALTVRELASSTTDS
jgi:hypothetical protein